MSETEINSASNIATVGVGVGVRSIKVGDGGTVGVGVMVEAAGEVGIGVALGTFLGVGATVGVGTNVAVVMKVGISVGVATVVGTEVAVGNASAVSWNATTLHPLASTSKIPLPVTFPFKAIC